MGGDQPTFRRPTYSPVGCIICTACTKMTPLPHPCHSSSSSILFFGVQSSISSLLSKLSLKKWFYRVFAPPASDQSTIT